MSNYQLVELDDNLNIQTAEKTTSWHYSMVEKTDHAYFLITEGLRKFTVRLFSIFRIQNKNYFFFHKESSIHVLQNIHLPNPTFHHLWQGLVDVVQTKKILGATPFFLFLFTVIFSLNYHICIIPPYESWFAKHPVQSQTARIFFDLEKQIDANQFVTDEKEIQEEILPNDVAPIAHIEPKHIANKKKHTHKKTGTNKNPSAHHMQHKIDDDVQMFLKMNKKETTGDGK